MDTNQDSHEEHNQALTDLLLRLEDQLSGKISGVFMEEELEDLFDHFYGLGKEQKALEVVEIGLVQAPFSASFLIRRAQIELSSSQSEEAFNTLQKAEILEPSNFEIFLLRGAIFDAKGDSIEAEKNYKLSLKNADQESYPILYSNLSNLYINQFRYKDAVSLLSKWLAHEPLNENIIEDLAYCYHESKDLTAALVTFSRIIDDYPYNPHAWLHLSLTHQKIGNQREALDALSYCIAIDDNNENAHLLRGDLYFQSKEISQALESYEEVLKRDSKNAMAMCGLGLCYEGKEQYELAKRWYFEALENDHDLGPAWFGLGLCELQSNNFDAALYYCEKAASLCPENADYWYNLGESYFSLGQLNQAKAAYKQSLQLRADYMESSIRLASIYFEEPDWFSMLEILEKGLEIHKDDPAYLYRFAGFLLETGSTKVRPKAIGILMQAMSQSPALAVELKKHHPSAFELKEVKALLGRV